MANKTIPLYYCLNSWVKLWRPDSIQKNGAKPKSHMSRRKKVLCLINLQWQTNYCF